MKARHYPLPLKVMIMSNLLLLRNTDVAVANLTVFNYFEGLVEDLTVRVAAILIILEGSYVYGWRIGFSILMMCALSLIWTIARSRELLETQMN